MGLRCPHDPYLGVERRKMVTITNEEYQWRRNLLIPMAEKVANEKCGRVWSDHHYAGPNSYNRAWTLAYITEMDRLWAMTVEAIAGLGGET